MRLLDALMHSSDDVVVEVAGHGIFRLPGAGARKDALRVTPLRYVLGDGVRALCDRIIQTWPDILDPSDPSLRVHTERLWMEWESPAACILVNATTQRCGLLATVDASGRRGIIESFWTDPQYGVDRGQVITEFDLDRPIGDRIDGRRHFAMPVQCPPAIARHARLVVDPGWLDYFSFTTMQADGIDEVVRRCTINSWRDLPTLLSFLRLLEVRPALTERPVERARLNAARAKHGKPALLDHLELGLRLGADPTIGPAGAAPATRSAPRLHLVRGHMVNRNGRLFWRSSHFRGHANLPALRSRTYRVTAFAG
jgi:hypothetical protein